jgi:hypothetical protein
MKGVPNLQIKIIPGVMQLESKGGSFVRTPSLSAFWANNCASIAALKRLDLCWFILALGATPSTAKKNNFFGFIVAKI